MRTSIVAESVELDEALRAEMRKMKRGVPYGGFEGMPGGVRNFLNDLCRFEPRNVHPMGVYPHALLSCARAGASWGDVIAALNYLKAYTWNRHYSSPLVCMYEAIARETNANAIQDHSVHRWLKYGDVPALLAVIEGCEVQLSETRVVRNTALSLLTSGTVS